MRISTKRVSYLIKRLTLKSAFKSVAFVILLISVFLTSCEYLKKQVNTTETRPIAKVNDAILDYSDIWAVTKSAEGRKDSADIVRVYVEDWVKRKLMIQKALLYLPSEKLDIEKQVNDYRESLVLYAYEKELILQKTDTLIPQEELLKYYDNFSQNFELERDVAQIHFVKVPKDIPKVDSLIIWFSSGREGYQMKLEDYCYQYATDFSFIDSVWYEVQNICRKIPVTPEQIAMYNRYQNAATVSDSLYYYLLKVNHFRNKGEIAPFNFVKPDITRIIRNNRKVDLIRSTYQTIYQEALRNNEFKIYQ